MYQSADPVYLSAMSSSKYLSELIKQGRIVPTPSEELDRILSIEATPPSSASPSPPELEKPPPSSDTTKPQSNEGEAIQQEKEIDYEPFMLLKSHTIKDLVKAFNLEHQLSIDLTRARQQTIKSIQQGQMDRLEKEAAGEGFKTDEVDRKAKL